MITRKTSARETRCRSCERSIPANTESYFVATVGNSRTNVFVCKTCIYDLITDVATDFADMNDLGEFIVLQKLSP